MKKFPPFSVLVKGLATSVPGAYRLFCKGSGGTISARYCYAVWMRHLILTQKSDLKEIPVILGELGPGDSIGIGLAGLLSGVNKYFALDVVKHISVERNLQIFEELVQMFTKKENVPDDKEFPDMVPLLDDYRFPGLILTDEILAKSLAPERLEAIRKSIRDNSFDGSLISYIAPWDDKDIISANSADLIISQYVLEHVNDLDKAYGAMYSWLKPGGMTSNVIDFQCHGTASAWNGHWQYSDLMWKMIVGGRPFLLNREPAQAHHNLIEKNNFKLFEFKRFYKETDLKSEMLDEQFSTMSDEDIKTLKVYFQAIK